MLYRVQKSTQLDLFPREPVLDKIHKIFLFPWLSNTHYISNFWPSGNIVSAAVNQIRVKLDFLVNTPKGYINHCRCKGRHPSKLSTRFKCISTMFVNHVLQRLL